MIKHNSYNESELNENIKKTQIYTKSKITFAIICINLRFFIISIYADDRGYLK